MAFKMRGFPAQGVSALKKTIKEDFFDVDKLADADDQKFLDEQREERVTEEDKELYRLQQAKKEDSPNKQTTETPGMPTFDPASLEVVSGEKKSIAYGGVADTPKNQALIQKQLELQEWKNNNQDMSDEQFDNYMKEMEKIQSQFTYN